MSIIETVVLGIIQGLTEFLPVSSSGHLAIAQNLFGLTEPMLSFDLLLHLGTQLAVIFFFGKRIIQLLKEVFKDRSKAVSILLPLILVTMPVVVIGFLFKDMIAGLFTQMAFVAMFYFVTAALLFSTKFIDQTRLTGKWEGLSWHKALVIGCFQAVSTLPGISRSGSTIVGGYYMGLNPSSAFEFSFLAGLISITGASVVDLMTADTDLVGTSVLGSFGLGELIGAAIAAIIGYLMLMLVAKLVKSGKFWWFGFYCVAVGGLAVYLAIR